MISCHPGNQVSIYHAWTFSSLNIKLNILQLPKEKLKVSNVLNESNKIEHIPKRIDKIINNYKDDVFSNRIGKFKDVKVSEYPFKQNKNILKNMTVLLYTNFYDVSLNVLRQTFFNICT